MDSNIVVLLDALRKGADQEAVYQERQEKIDRVHKLLRELTELLQDLLD